MSVFSRAGVAEDERPIQKIADADSERNDAERCNRPDVAIRLDAGNQSEGSDVADGSADQQDAGAAARGTLGPYTPPRGVGGVRSTRGPLLARATAQSALQ